MNMNIINAIAEITGSGKGGGGYKEDPNSLNSATTISTLEVLSCGPIKGLVAGQKSIYFDDIPVESSDGQKNFEIATDIRLGLPSQPYMAGYPQAEAIIEVNSDINDGIDAVYTTSAPDVDRMRLGISLPSGLYWQGDNGISKTDIEIDIYTALEDGVYSKVATWAKLDEKTMAPYLGTIDIARPVGTGHWSVKLVKVTPPYDDRMHNDAKLASVTEIKDVQLSYDGFAYVGLKIPAKEVSNKNPERIYHVDGVLCQVPSNYDAVSATYSGEWDGTFKTEWTDNPVWVLYDLLTNETYGCGRWVKESDIDIYSFYDASVYCDGLIPDGKDGLERRFTFNAVLNQQDSWLTVLQQVASNFNAVLIKSGTLWRLQQDRPTAISNIITNADVVDGVFTYSGSQHKHRHTLVNVTYLDKTNLHKKQVVSVEAAPSDIERYNGYTTVDIAAIGCDRESQAVRCGKWYIDTELNQLETVNFQMGFNGMLVDIGDVIKVADANYTLLTNQGKILDVVGNSLSVDRPVTYQVGDKVSFVDASGVFQTITLTSSASDSQSIALPSAYSAVGSFVIESEVQNRLFRISSISESAPNVLAITAVQHDPDKYARIEQGVSVVAPPYTTINKNKAKPVTNISFTLNAYRDDDSIRRDLVVSFTPPLATAVLEYECQWRSNGGAWTTITTDKTSFDIQRISEGTYDVRITTIGVNGTRSKQVTGTYEYSLSSGTGSLLNPVQNLEVLNHAGTTFFDRNLDLVWTNPVQNTVELGVILKDFRIDIKDPETDEILYTDYSPAVPAGETRAYTYLFDQNKLVNNGVPSRTIKVTVYCRDTNNKISVGNTKTFFNPPIPAPSIIVTPGVKSLKIEPTTRLDRITHPDYLETIYCVSDDPSFVPSLDTAVARGDIPFYMMTGVESGTTYYCAVAYADSFGEPINWSPIVSETPATPAGIPEVEVLPASPADVNGHTGVMYKAPGTSEYILYGWDGDKWMNTRDGGYLVDYSVVASKIYAEDLRAISANLGAITSGSITFDQTSYIRGGAVTYGVGTGIWQGWHTDAYKWRVGTPGGAGAAWDGTNFIIYGHDGSITLQSGQSLSADWLTLLNKPSSLSAISASEANKLNGIQAGATVGAPAGTLVAGVDASNLANVFTNFNNSNDQNGTPITAPVVLADGTAVDHIINTDSSADISFEWTWSGNEADIDGFLVFVYSTTSSSVYSFGTSPAAETVYTVPAQKRAFILFGQPANKYYTFGVRAYRKVDKNISASGIIQSSIVKPSISSENPYRPSSSVAFSGDITGTIQTYYGPLAAGSVNIWSAVSGAGKPQDYATFGATIGNNLYQGSTVVNAVVSDQTKITSSNISTFMTSAAIGQAYIGNAAIGSAQIQDANVTTLKIAGNAVTVPSGGNGIYSASATINLPQPGYITVIGTFTQGTGKGGHTWRLYVGGAQVAFENPAVATTGAMSYTAYVGAGGQSCAIQCDQQSGDGRCSITVLGSMR